ncbi:AraC family transcriptional regulator [Persicobacter psychrovividus]|uniref:HTH araC/xylS-type domain-containing protein n=1 Tax=Persicobacter psychrovividus TaxID=387638 RepID=A0ABN6LFW7_9BACT|nr:hypothetical protein PEPS_43280 [Persicobacter psychrovividus]
MALEKVRPKKGDPAEIEQLFPNYDLQIHCCRYWWLQNWEFEELSFPYWRVYYNNHQGAVIIQNEKEYRLTPDKVIIIPPNTSYATRLHDHPIPRNGFSLTGGRFTEQGTGMNGAKESNILHLFIHFNIGMPYDNCAEGIFELEVTPQIKKNIEEVKRLLNYEHTKFSLHSSLTIQSLISHLLTKLPNKLWQLESRDHRVIDVLNFIDNNISEELTNPFLAEKAKMATNSFTRLFTEEIGMSPQKYVKKKRIDKACILLHHSSQTIDQIAFDLGFNDRYHFSKSFKQLTSKSPAKYRKEYGV